MVRKIRRQRKTLLAVGEGDSEVAFLKHLRELYCSDGDGVKVTIANANGKGPENVVEHAAGIARMYAYDKRLCLLDTDLIWTPKAFKKAKTAQLELIGSTPCLESLLLLVLNQAPPQRSSTCKKQLQLITKADMTEREHYAALFSKTVLNAAQLRMPELALLLKLFRGDSY